MILCVLQVKNANKGSVTNMPVTPNYVATTIVHARLSLITWLPASERGQDKAVLKHRHHVRRAMLLHRRWRAGIDYSAPLVTRRTDGRTVVTFTDESTEWHRFRSLEPTGIPLVVINRDKTRARLVRSDGTILPVSVDVTPAIAEMTGKLRETIRRMRILESHFLTPNKVHPRYARNDWILSEYVALAESADILQTSLRHAGAFTTEGDTIADKYARQAHAARNRRYRDNLKYSTTPPVDKPARLDSDEVTVLWSWLRCYCPHLNKKVGK